MGKIAFIRAAAFVCSIAAKVLAIPFVLLAKLLRGVVAMMSQSHQRGKERREHKKEQRRLRKEQRQDKHTQHKKLMQEQRQQKQEQSRLRKEQRQDKHAQHKKLMQEQKLQKKEQKQLQKEQRQDKRTQHKKLMQEQRQLQKEQKQAQKLQQMELRRQRKEQKWKIRLERQKQKEKTWNRRKKVIKKDYLQLTKKLSNKYRDGKLVWILRAAYAVGILGVKAYWVAVIILQKVYWGSHWLFRKTYWAFHWLFQKTYWGFHWLFRKIYWGFHWLFRKTYWAFYWLFQKTYWGSRRLFQKIHEFFRGLSQKTYWFFRSLFQKAYWFLRGLFQKAYWFFHGLFQKIYWFFRGLFQKTYWFFHGLFQKAYWFFRGLFQKAYWFFRGILQKAYWNFYYPRSRKIYQFLCKNAYIELYFVFLRRYMKQSTERINCLQIMGIQEYVQSQKSKAQYQVVEAGKIRSVCIPAYFEKSEEAIEQFQSPDIYTAELQDVYLIGGSNVVVAGNTLLNDAVYQDKEHRIDIRYSAIKNVFNGIAIIEDYDVTEEIERGINLVGAASFNYYHLVVEILSRLAFVDSQDTYQNYPILVDEVVLRIPQFRSALECINRLNHPVIKVEKNKKYLVRDLVLPSSNVWMPTNVYNREQIRVSDFMISDTVLHTIRRSVKVWEERPAWRKIFISRKNTQAVRLKNEEAVRDMFAKNGFEIVFTEEMSFRQQVECFGQAKCIVATSGAALTNTIFCQPGTLVGCIIPSAHRFYMYSTIAYTLGLTPLFLDAEIIDKTPYAAADTFILDCQYVTRYIKEIQKKFR